MKIKHYLIVFFFGVLFTQNCLIGQQAYSQNEFSKHQNDSTRKVFVYAGIGLLEAYNIGIGYQGFPNFAVSLKYSTTFIGSGFGFPNTSSGIGIKLSFFIPFSIFNCMNAEYVSYLSQSSTHIINSTTKGNFFDFNIGKEIADKKGLRIFGGVGISISAAKEATVTYSPSLKIGINYNLF